MGKTDGRNQSVREILDLLFQKANDKDLFIEDSTFKQALDNLFTTTTWGFREILLVVVVGMKLDEDYRASTGLYDCNPRAIYEGPIKEFLIDNNIPHRKSGPLNVAKATEGLNLAWSVKRRPQEVAENVVEIVNMLEDSTSQSIVDDIGISLLRRLIMETKRVEELNVEIELNSDPVWLYHISNELIRKTPDAGNTPQKIVAFLLKNYHLYLNTGVVVTGVEDRASVTSTTSKKPGDINEESVDGTIYKVYEITVKAFDLARIRDSYDSVNTYNENNKCNINEIIVICRPEDCPSEIRRSGLHFYLGSYLHHYITYYYWDICELVSNTLQRMTFSGREAFYSDLNDYISEVNTAEKVKNLWRELHIGEV